MDHLLVCKTFSSLKIILHRIDKISLFYRNKFPNQLINKELLMKIERAWTTSIMDTLTTLDHTEIPASVNFDHEAAEKLFV